MLSNLMKSTKVKVLTSTLVFGTTMMLFKAHALADSASEALSKAGITKTDITGEGSSTFFGSMKTLIGIIMGFGLMWSVLFLVFGAMQLASSNGNPQKRAVGIAALFSASIGIFIIYKAWNIAGWAVSLGG